ncbi:MAG TPA: hypothetical protein VFA05_00600 [Gaiellaceae bacterium]|nr:hypothetical protein [Gaiellaceae bacterium]
MTGSSDADRSGDGWRRAVRLCDELLQALAAFRPRDEAILQLERDIEDTRLDALRSARRADRTTEFAPPAVLPPSAPATPPPQRRPSSR